MKLIKFELYKLFTKKVLLIFVFVLFSFNWFLFYNSQTNNLFTNSKEYQSLEFKYSQMNPKEALEEISYQQNYLGFISRIASDREIGIDEDIIKSEVQFALSFSPEIITYEELIARYGSYLSYIDELHSILNAYDALMGQLQHVISYPEFINSMEEKAKSMESISVFSNKDTFAYRNIIKTIDDYEDLKGVGLSLGQEEGVLALSSFNLTDYFLLALIIFICIFLYSDERESGMLSLIKTTKKGRLNLALSKTIVLIIFTMALAIMFYGVNFLLSKSMYGFGDTSRLIQSMSSFRDADIPMTLKQYFLWFGILKLFGLIIFALIASLIFITVSSTKLTYIITGIILTMSYLAYEFIYPTSYINVLKFMNIFAFLDSYHLLANYTNLNIFGYPKARVVTTIVTMTIIGLLCCALYLICFATNINQFLYINLRFIKPKKIINLKRGSVNLFSHELYKNLLSNKILYLLVLSFMIGYSNLNIKELYYTYDELVYSSYAIQLEGEVTVDKTSFVNEEQKRFDNLSNQMQVLNEQLDNNEISKDDYRYESLKVSDFASRITGFKLAKDQYEQLQTLQVENGIDVHFINSISSDYIFKNPTRDLFIGLIYSVLLVLCLGNVFCCEYSKGMINIIRSTRNGRWRLFFCKSLIAYGTSNLLMIILYLPFYITLMYRYKLTDWSAPIQSIRQYSNIGMDISILEFIIVTLLLQLLTTFVMTTILTLLSQLLKKQTLTILIGLILLSVPFIFSFISDTIFQKATFVAGFSLYHLFTGKNAISFAFTYFVAITLIGISAGFFAYRRFCNNR